MCAIIGVAGELPSTESIKYARDTMKHRGPDDAGLYYNPGERITLGHRRLSIIDLSDAGRQPFHSQDGRFIVVFNGEIYNYLEIKEELLGFYSFSTGTDTEVLLASYIKWGARCLDKLNGMFAFAIWDRRERKLFCARDRLGIKPFYYSIRNSTIYFASEIKALLALGLEWSVNENAVFDYLYYGLYDHTDETFFSGIKRLPSGHYLLWCNNTVTMKRYWDLVGAQDSCEGLGDGNIQEKFKELVTDSIRLRFRSDVPVGINLSSGLDSSSLLYYSREVIGKNVHTFSMCLPSREYNECLLIQDFLNEKQKRHWHTSYLEPGEVFSLAEEMNKIQDQPYGGIPTIAYTKLGEQAQEKKIAVLLEGQGLDELLAGYQYYWFEYEKDLHSENAEKVYNEYLTPSSVDYSQDMSQLIDRNILAGDFISSRKKEELLFRTPFQSHLLNAQYRDLAYTKLPRVLRFNDHVMMAHGRELRVPFLDHRIVEFCFFLPVRYKIQKDSHKVLVREAMKEYLPDIISSKQKKTFGAVQTEWFRNHHRDEIFSFLTSRSFKERAYWNHGALMKKVDNFFRGEGNNSFFLWQCINLEMWFRRFIDNSR